MSFLGSEPPGSSASTRGSHHGRSTRTSSSNSYDRSSEAGTSVPDAGSRGRGRGYGSSRGRGRGRGGSGRGGKNDGAGAPQKARPTHFLALPLHNHSTLRTRVGNFQNALLTSQPPISGLDPTIVIDPRRLHLTLGVMALEGESQLDVNADEENDSAPPIQRKTVDGALQLLDSLRPQIAALLEGNKGVKVPLEVMDVFPPGATSGANVLFLGPDVSPVNGTSSPEDEKMAWKRRLLAVSNFVHREFKKAGYITEKRPLKLHCTILNASHRKPRRWISFSYDEVLKSDAHKLISGTATLQAVNAQEAGISPTGGVEISEGSSIADPSQSIHESFSNLALNDTPSSSRGDNRRGSVPISVDVGVFDVRRLELWVMGSRGPNNEYVSLGGITLE